MGRSAQDGKQAANTQDIRQVHDPMRQQAAVTPARSTVISEYGQKYNQEMVLYGAKDTPMSVTVAWIDSAKTNQMTFVSAMQGKVKI